MNNRGNYFVADADADVVVAADDVDDDAVAVVAVVVDDLGNGSDHRPQL